MILALAKDHVYFYDGARDEPKEESSFTKPV